MRGVVRAAHLRLGSAAVRMSNLFRPELSLGVRLLALDEAGRVFLVRHSYVPDLHLPGGAVDLGESCREAAVREAREEGNLVLDAPPELFHVYWNPVGTRRDHVVLFVARGVRQSAPRPGLARDRLRRLLRPRRPARLAVRRHPPPARRGARRHPALRALVALRVQGRPGGPARPK